MSIKKSVSMEDITELLNKHFIKYVRTNADLIALTELSTKDLVVLNNTNKFSFYSVRTTSTSNTIQTSAGLYLEPIESDGTSTATSEITKRVKYTDISQSMNNKTDMVPSMALLTKNDLLYARVSNIISDFTTGGTGNIASGEAIKILYQMIQTMGNGGASKLEYYLQRASKSKITSTGTLTKGSTVISITTGVLISPMVYINGELLTPDKYTVTTSNNRITLKSSYLYDAFYYIVDEYAPQFKFSVPFLDHLMMSTALKNALMIDDVICVQGNSAAFDGEQHYRVVQSTAGLNAVLVKTGVYLNEIKNSRASAKQDKIDNRLTTTSKDIVLAINEINKKLNDLVK